jgi:hypothetical protein
MQIRSALAIVVAVLTTIFAIIALVLSAHLNLAVCAVPLTMVCAASGLGIAGGGLGIVLSIAIVSYQCISRFESWKVVLALGMFLTGAVAFTSGVLWGIFSTRSGTSYFFELGAACAMELYFAMFAIVLGVIILLDQ